MTKFNFEVEGIEVEVNTSAHAQQRMEEREISSYQVAGAIVMLGEDILDMKDRHEFIIIDEDLNASYVCIVHVNTHGEVFIDVVTVVNTKDIWNKRGTQILRLA